MTSTSFKPDVQISSARFLVIFPAHSTSTSPVRGESDGSTMSPTASLPSIFATLRPSTIASLVVV